MIIHVLTKIGVLFFVLAFGALARFKKVITDKALDDLCKIVLYVTLPFLFIYVLATRCTWEALSMLWMGPLFAGAIISVGYVVGRIASRLLKLPPKKSDTLTLVISFQNSAFLAIPIAFALFGEDGVLHIIMFSIGFNVLYWTFGVWLISRSGSSGKVHPLANLLNPATCALALGLVLGVFAIKLPRVILDGSKLLGDATIPLGMLVVGAILASTELSKKAGFKEALAIVVCRLVIIPAIFFCVAGWIKGITPLMRSIIVLQACMPSASTSPLLAKRFGGDHELAASGVFFTTLCSIITVPIFMSLIV